MKKKKEPQSHPQQKALAKPLLKTTANTQKSAKEKLSPEKRRKRSKIALIVCSSLIVNFVAAFFITYLITKPMLLDASVTTNGLEVKYPSSWTVKQSTASDDENETKDGWWIYPSDTIGLVGVSSTVSLSSQEFTSDSDDGGSTESYLDGVTSEINGQTIGEPEYITLENSDIKTTILKQKVSGYIENTDLVGYVGAIITDGYLFSCIAMVEENDSEKYMSTLESIIDNLDLKPSNYYTVTYENSDEGVFDNVDARDYGNGAIIEAPSSSEFSDTKVINSFKVADPKSKVKIENSSGDTFFTNIKADTTIIFTWAPQYTVVFKNGKKTVDKQLVNEGEDAEEPEDDPEKDGYKFKGWDKKFTKVTKDLVVNAKWKKLPTLAEQNALDKALDYLDSTSFSKQGLIEQLEYEGFTKKEATYGAEHCGANWKKQAALKAQDYLDYTSFSRQGLIKQLEHEGFTHSQAVYGVNKVGL